MCRVCICMCMYRSVGAYGHLKLQIPLELKFQVVGSHLTWVLGTELVSLGNTGCATNSSDLYLAHSFILR